MKVTAFNGSQEKMGIRLILIKEVFTELEKSGITTEDHIPFSGKSVHGCLACRKCFVNKNRRCAIDTDFINECIEKMVESDAIILGHLYILQMFQLSQGIK